MSVLRAARSSCRQAGYSVLELTVAMALTSTVVSLVYATWNRLNVHMYSQQRKVALHRECMRISQFVEKKIRKADKVIEWETDEISFTVSGTGESTDTVTFTHDGETLECNGKPVSLLLPHTAVTVFSLRNTNDEAPSVPYMFEFMITLCNTQGDSATSTSTVLVKKPYSGGDGGDFMW